MEKEEISWSPIKDQIMTRWSENVDFKQPLSEYPRPQMKRDKWLNLNGLWEYAIRPKNEDIIDSFNGKILVPFPLESALSGVKRNLNENQILWYSRKFIVPIEWKDKKILLHFGAVDWEAEVWINQNKIGIHQGGYTPFSFEISRFLNFNTQNELILKVWDPTDNGSQERGKQSLHPQNIWYTAVSGIWQTVWLEPVSESFVESFQLKPDIDRQLLRISLSIQNASPEHKIRVELFEGKSNNLNLISEKENFTLNVPNPNLWSPDNPFLYDLVIKLEQKGQIIDEIKAYFGMRKINLGAEKVGIKSIKLNNKKLFQYGTLDQGYWPDGLYTAPTDEALRYDIEITKELGFNMIRKHVKIEPARWYHHCDKIGILVWQDMPNGGSAKIIGDRVNSNDLKQIRKDIDKRNYFNELESMISSLSNFPSIITWVSFNEGWGQFDTETVCKRIKKLDSSRLINAASGWYDLGIGDICDRHSYPNPIMPQKEKVNHRAAVVGEFGGIGLEVENHMWNIQNKFVYRNYSDQKKLMERYAKLILKLKKLIEKGLSAAIYTQITDVEQEMNGLLTYDREVIKMEKEKTKKLNISLYN